MTIRTLGELREALEHYGDDTPLWGYDLDTTLYLRLERPTAYHGRGGGVVISCASYHDPEAHHVDYRIGEPR